MQFCPFFRQSFWYSTFVFIHIAGSSFIFNIFMVRDISKSLLPLRAKLRFPFLVQELSLLFSSTSWHATCKYLCFHKHRGMEKSDIFSTCVFNNIVALAFIFYSPRFLVIVKPMR
jgi:hypothetical protein